MFKTAILALAVTAAAGATHGAEIFFEDFDEAPTSANNFTGFDQFSVESGTVDAFTNGGFGLSCPSLGCVDLDGSTLNAGIFASEPISFLAGATYTLSFNIGGSQRGSALETVQFGISTGILTTEALTFLPSDPYSVVSRSFSVAADTTGNIFFDNSSADNIGALLDYVRVELSDTSNPEVIPLPAALPMLAVALGLLGVVRRRG